MFLVQRLALGDVARRGPIPVVASTVLIVSGQVPLSGAGSRCFLSPMNAYLSLSQTYWLAVDRESGDADL